jgi:hypothetical protein
MDLFVLVRDANKIMTKVFVICAEGKCCVECVCITTEWR